MFTVYIMNHINTIYLLNTTATTTTTIHNKYKTFKCPHDFYHDTEFYVNYKVKWILGSLSKKSRVRKYDQKTR